MKNGLFEIGFDNAGGITRLSLAGDETKMNFCRAGGSIGALVGFCPLSFTEGEAEAIGISSCDGLEATTTYRFEGEHLTVTTVLKNTNAYPIYAHDGEICIEMATNDAYEASDICMRERCHTHIFAGLESSYIRTERMGESSYHIGIAFERGSISSYSQRECHHSVRGYFSLGVSAFSLLGGESYTLKYRIFRHAGREDFFQKAKSIPGFLQVTSPCGYSFVQGDTVDFEIHTEAIESAEILLDEAPLAYKAEKDRICVSFPADMAGEKEVIFRVNSKAGKAVFYVSPPYEDLIRTRIDFIITHQQCTDARSPLFGAYLIYDNEAKRQYFNHERLDWNANRERMGMALTILKWLQTHEDARVRESLDRFTDFLLRECVDEEKGTCYGNIGKDERFLRLYNAPWVALYFSELYNLTKELRWANLLARILRYYYGVGGAKFYPNGIRFYTFYKALIHAGLEKDAEEIYRLFDAHIETILKNGTNYPPHEVNFEQTIVTPATTLLLDKYAISKDPFYLHEAEKHLRILRKFDGAQPHYRLNNIPIRYWDDYWFGKTGIYGDVCPHYWSVLSGYAYHYYGLLAGNEEAIRIGDACIRSCLCNIHPDGSATCAYVFPAFVHGKIQPHGFGRHEEECMGALKGAFEDAFANDQDFALYFFMKIREEEEKSI